MKTHIGVDAESGLVRTLVTTASNVHDVTQAQDLLTYEGAGARTRAAHVKIVVP
jgi:IS5 family transposase